MSVSVTPCLSLAIARLHVAGSEHFAIWVTQSPLPGGYVHHDLCWSDGLTQKWIAWQEMFSLQQEPHLPVIQESAAAPLPPVELSVAAPGESYSGRLMQELGIALWQWLLDGSIRQSLAQSQGIALGKNKPLRLRLEIRDANLVPLPWEIMQPELGKPSVALDPQILFSRTTSNVEPLGTQHYRESLNILLVLGEESLSPCSGSNLVTPPLAVAANKLQLEAEAAMLTDAIQQGYGLSATPHPYFSAVVPRVHTLVQPTPAELIEALDTGLYNIFFYAGHGMPAPDGGLLFLRPDATINGTELAQVLVRDRVTLAVFNACWGAQPARQGQQAIERSSLAEVLIHHGVPVVLGMRDSIANQEALSFIHEFTKALAQRMPVDRAVRVARQQLVTLYKFNQPAWTLPILYMHPEFEGDLLKPREEGATELPVMSPSLTPETFPVACVRSLETQDRVWKIYGGFMRVGRHQENDLIIGEQWVSQRHAEIICRETPSEPDSPFTYFLKDFSRFGTFVYGVHRTHECQKVHHQEIPLKSGVRLQFGSTSGQILEFIIEG
jgi:hypothetical protein